MPLHSISGVRVRTTHERPPIPVRDFDWSAVLDDEYDGASHSQPIGAGLTEAEAIDDLLKQVKEPA